MSRGRQESERVRWRDRYGGGGGWGRGRGGVVHINRQLKVKWQAEGRCCRRRYTGMRQAKAGVP